MSEVQTTPRLSLFQIESELLGLLDQREDALGRCLLAGADRVAADACSEEIKVLDGLIRDYVAKEVKKVDGIAWAVKDLRAKSEAKKKEADELYAKSKADEETADRILSFALEVLQQSGSKREEGKFFKLTRQGNGGIQALTIAQPDLVPDVFRTATVRMSLRLLRMFVKELSEVDCREMYGTTTEPDTKLIREALERGIGVMGCRLEPRGQQIRIK